MKLWVGSLSYVGDPKALEMPDPLDSCQGELNTWSGATRNYFMDQKSMIWPAKMEGMGLLTLDKELQDMVFVLLC